MDSIDGWRVSLPPESSVYWPALPHDPYVKDGRADLDDGRIAIAMPFDDSTSEFRLTVEVLREKQ